MSDLVNGLNEALRKQTWLDRGAVPLQKAVSGFFEKLGPVGTKIADLLNGVWLGHPLHPVITDVPIGSWTAALALDVLAEERHSRGLERGADTAIAIGVVSAAGAAVAGLADWQHTVGESRRTGFLHAALNTLSLTLFIGTMAARSSRNRSLGRDLAVAGYVVAGASAFLGGDLVYRQKIGINHAPEQDEIKVPEFTPVMESTALLENQLTRATVKNISLVLLRRGAQVFALAETCAHLGGPLAEGEIKENEEGYPVVVCPWHGSHFNMHNGNLVRGPSAYPQPCFEARINNGMVEVRFPTS